MERLRNAGTWSRITPALHPGYGIPVPHGGDRSDFREIVGGWREHLVDRELPDRQTLVVGIARQRLEHVPVRLVSLAPEILAHDAPQPVEFGDAPRQRRRQMADLAKLVHAQI